MGIILSLSTVIFVILCVLLVILILLQTDKNAGMGILGGSSQSAFGSSTADVITKITAYLVGFFMLISLGLASMESYRIKELEREAKLLIAPHEEVLSPQVDIEKQDEQPVENTGN